MQKRHLLLPCLLLVSALFLAACGGGGGGDDEGKIEGTIEKVATGGDPAACTELATMKFVEQNASEEGKAALKTCEKEASDGEDQAKSVDVAEVEVNGSDATAEVTFQGSSLDGQSIEVTLVKDGDVWKLDETVGFTNLDQAKLAASVGKAFKKQGGEGAELAGCAEEAFEEANQSEIEEDLFSGSEKPFIEALQAACE